MEGLVSLGSILKIWLGKVRDRVAWSGVGEGGCRALGQPPLGNLEERRGLSSAGAQPSGGCLESARSLCSVWDPAGARARLQPGCSG